MEFGILGPLTVTRNRRPVPLHGARQRRLLAMLLLHANTIVPFSRLTDELWEVPPATAHQQIYNAMAALRRSLRGPGCDVDLTTADEGYLITVGEAGLDLLRFQAHLAAARHAEKVDQHAAVAEHLRAALGEWRGPALPGLDDRTMAAAVVGLQEQRLTAVERYAALRVASGDHGALVSELFRWVAEHPLREPLRGCLMLALHRSGRQADALTVYDEGRRVLAEELGIEPGEQLRRLHERILRGGTDTADLSLPPVGSGAVAPARVTGARAAAGPAVAPRQRIGPGTPTPRTTAPRPGAGPASTAPMVERRAAGLVPAPGSWPIHCSLPHDTIDFAGREEELAALRTGMSGAGTALVISTVSGMGGVGKTALAVRLSHLVAPEYPDGQYYVDLRGFTAGQQPLTPYAALDLLLRNSRVPQEQVPPDLDGRTALWRSITARKRILLLLDNAKSAEHVRALLPNASGSLVVVTSRRRLSDLDGATPVLLDVLPMPDAIDLFQRCAGGASARSPDGTAGIARVVEACGRLPLAIRIAASRLRNRPNWTVADLAERLTEHRRRARLLTVDDQTIGTVLGLSYRYLEPEAQLLFRLLGVHPGSDLDAYAAAALVGWPVEQTEDVLDRLVEDNLVHQGSDHRYRLHDLVRDFAMTMSEAHDSAADRDTARHRLFDYYLHLAFTHCAPMARGPYRITPTLAHPPTALPHRSGPGAGLQVLKDEYQNLVDVAHAATQYGLREHAWQLPCVLQPFLTRMHYREQSLPLFQAALSAAWALGDERAESAALGSIALIMRERGDYAETQDLFDRAIAISRRLGDTASEVYQLADLGYAQRLAGRLSQAHATFAEAAQLAERTGDREGYGTVVNSLGVVDLAIGRTEVAIRHFEAALAATREVGSGQDEALVLGNLAWARTAQGDTAAALPLFDASIAISRSMEYRYGEAMAMARRAAAQQRLGEAAAALSAARAALALARDAGLHTAECEALTVIAEALMADGETAAAQDAFTTAHALADAFGLPAQRGRASEGLGEIDRRRGDVAAARWHLEQARDAYPEEAVERARVRDGLAALPDPPRSGPGLISETGPESGVDDRVAAVDM